MKHLILCLGVLLSTYFGFCQTVKSTITRSGFGVQVDENTIVRDSTGVRVSYPNVLKMVYAGNYTLDPVKNSQGEITSYIIRKAKASDAGKREAVMRTPGTEGLPKPKTGEGIPDFLVHDMNGEAITAENLKGKVTVISFWYVTCKACLNEMPYINAMGERFSNNPDVVFLAPTPEPYFTVKKFQEIQAFSYIACPEASSLIDALHVTVYPTHVVIGKDGHVLKSYSGGLPGVEDLIKRDIEGALKSQAAN
jgi:cytochrome oxidase Cu insertion factor (SCO1/SenC/PrrC family)